MTPAGIRAGELWALVRETRALERGAVSIAVSGPGAGELAARLAADGDGSIVCVGLDPARSVASIVLLDAAPAPAELEAMRRAARVGVPLVVVRAGGFVGDVPYAFPSDVIDAAGDVPLDRLADVLAAALDDDHAVVLAGRLPVLRDAVERRVIGRTALVNAAIGAAPWMTRAHLPLMTLAQGRMLLGLAVAHGDALPSDPQELVAAAAPPLGGAVAAGLGFRALYRRLPVRGPLVAAGVAYVGTRALGELRRRIALA